MYVDITNIHVCRYITYMYVDITNIHVCRYNKHTCM